MKNTIIRICHNCGMATEHSEINGLTVKKQYPDKMQFHSHLEGTCYDKPVTVYACNRCGKMNIDVNSIRD